MYRTFYTFDVGAQLQLGHLPLQKDVDPRQVFRPDVRQQDGVDSVEVSDQLPEAGLRVGAAVHQHREAVNGEEGAVAAARGEHVAAGAGQLEEAHGDGRRQEVEGGRRGEGAGDEGGEFAQGLHGGQHLGRVDAQREGLVPHESLPPLADVGTAEGQAEFGGGGGALLIYELKEERFLAVSYHL